VYCESGETSKKLRTHSKRQNSALGIAMERLTRLSGTGVPYPAALLSQSVVLCSGSEDPSNCIRSSGSQLPILTCEQFLSHEATQISSSLYCLARRTPDKPQSIEKKLQCVKLLCNRAEENRRFGPSCAEMASYDTRRALGALLRRPFHRHAERSAAKSRILSSVLPST